MSNISLRESISKQKAVIESEITMGMIEGDEDLARRRLTEKSREGEWDWEEHEVDEEERRL